MVCLLYRVIELKQQSLRNPQYFLFVNDLLYIFNQYFNYPRYWYKYIDPSAKFRIGLMRVRVLMKVSSSATFF